MERHRLLAGIACGALLLVATPFLTWLYCSHSSSSDFVLDAMIIAFSLTISCLLAAVLYCLLRIGRGMVQKDSARLPRTCDRCIGVCNVSAAIILSFLGMSLLWTIFIIAVLYLPYQGLSSLQFNWRRLLLYVGIAANLAFHLSVRSGVKRYLSAQSCNFR